MRSGHGRAAKKCVRIIGGVSAGASRVARGGDIGFYPAASIDCDRAAAAKGSDVVGTGVQRANCVGSRIQGWRIYHSGTRRPGITRCHHHLDTGGSLGFDSSLQRVRRTTFGRRADPGVTRNIGCFGRVALIGCAVERVRRQEPFHALDVSGWCAVALVHVTATNPFCARRHSDLVTHAIVADHGAGSVRAMSVVIARKLRIVPARIADAVMD